MHLPKPLDYSQKESFYKSLLQELEAILEGEWLMDLANTSALLNFHLPDINWVGFYLLKDEELKLGPFQGQVACTRIKLGRGVCGKAALIKKSLVVPDVHAFPDHIACDIRSRSEIVIPLLSDSEASQVLGVLDIDSPIPGRFDSVDEEYLKKLCKVLVIKTNLRV